MSNKLDKIEAEISLKDNGFLDAIDRVQKKTGTYKKEAENTKTVNDKLASSFRSTAQGIAVVDGPLGGIASRFSSAASLISGASLVTIGFGAALSGLALVMAKSVTAGEQMERQLYKQEAVLKATGYAAGWNAEQLDKMARDTAFATLASVEDIREAQNVMLTFRRVQGDVFEEAIGLTQDLAVVLGGSAASNAKMLGKALEDPITGITAMSRAGVSFSTSQKEMIKSMVEAGNQAEAQRMILAELQKQVGGAGAGEAQGLSGAIDTLGQQFQTLFENIDTASGAGSAFAAVINRIARGVGRTAAMLQEAPISERLKKAFDERLELEGRIQNATNARVRKSLEQRKAIVDAQLKALSAEQKAIAEKDVNAYWKSKQTQSELEREKNGEILAEKQKSGAEWLAALDANLATEREKIDKEYKDQLLALETLTLSEEEVKARGFDNIAQLRLTYQAELEAQYNNEVQALNDKLAAEQKAKDDAARRDEERRKREAAKEEERLRRLIGIAQSSFDAINERYEKEFLSAEEYENRRWELEQKSLNDHANTLFEQGRWTEKNEQEFRETRTRAEKLHQRNLTKIHESEQREREDVKRKGADALVGMASSEFKELSAIGKAAAIYNIGVRMREDAINSKAALSMIPIVGPALGWAAAAASIAFGAEQIASVAGLTEPSYHTGGIAGQPADNYGAKLKAGEINATLMVGEEILTADDPRHRNNLQIYESGNYGGGGQTVNMGGIYVTVDATGARDANGIAQTVANQVAIQLGQFVASKSFQNATVGAVSKYARQNSGRLPNVRT